MVLSNMPISLFPVFESFRESKASGLGTLVSLLSVQGEENISGSFMNNSGVDVFNGLSDASRYTLKVYHEVLHIVSTEAAFQEFHIVSSVIGYLVVVEVLQKRENSLLKIV